MTNFLIPVTVNVLPDIATLEGRQGMFILPDGTININKKSGEWIVINSLSNYMADNHGVILPTTPVPVGGWKKGWYEPKISSALPGTNYPNQNNLKSVDGYFTKFYFDGTSWDIVSRELPEAVVPTVPPVFDENDSNHPQAGKQIAEWVGAKDVVVPKILGVNLVGASTSPINTSGAMVSNASCKALKKTVVKNVVTNASVGGDFKIAVTDSSNAIIFTSTVNYTVAAGSQITPISDLTLKNGDTIWILGVSGSTLVLKYGSNAAVVGNFIQRSAAGIITNGPNTTFYSMYFNVEEISNDGILGQYLKKTDADGYQNIDPLETFGDLVSTTGFGNQSAIGYYVLKIPFTTDKTILQIDVRANAGIMNFAIGTIDQENKFIEDRVFIKTVVAGVNNIIVDEELKKGQRLAVKTPGFLPHLNTSIANNYLWSVEGSYSNSLAQNTSYSLALAIRVKTRLKNEDAFARQSEIKNLQSQINNFQTSNIFTSSDGTKWKFGVSNAGTTVWQAVGRYTKILHFGNSILKHAIVSYWWGFWGMAAKTRNDDYAHKFLSKIQVSNPTAQSWEENIAAWEANPSGFNKASLDTILTAQTYDLIVVRLGENVTYNSGFKDQFRNLITYFQTKVPTARIIIGSTFWVHGQKDADMQAIAVEKNLTYVSMAGLDIPENKSFIGDIVQGDDGQSHTVNNSGVADHPNNAGMNAIATRLFNAANT